MKKLINAPAAVVPDMLRGLAMADNRLLLSRPHNVVLRADYAQQCEAGRVALISGGGAGHEPAHAGYVGAGMLTAAVTGAVFTSPSVDAVLAAIRIVTGPAGCLLIVKNYTGDRLNFGLAMAIARSEGLSVDMVLVDDDVALAANGSRAGARGLAGTVLVHKVAGATSEAGATLQELVADLTAFIAGIGTMGVALSPCINPSAGLPSFELDPNEVEYGLGIHGERGASREALREADAVATRLVNRIISEKRLEGGTRVVLLVNGLGGTPPSEIAIMTGGAIAAARAQGLHVERVASGALLTALEMAGCSISLAAVDAPLLSLIDAPTQAPAWPGATHPVEALALVDEPTAKADLVGDALPVLPVAEQSRLESAIKAVAHALVAAEADLTALDRVVGDGDLGISLERGARAVLDEIETLDLSHPALAMQGISNILRRAIGGTSGPLYAAFTLAVSTRLREADAAPGLFDWAQSMQAGCLAISQLGGAHQGDCTMLDALIPAAEAMLASVEGGSAAAAALSVAAEAARRGAEATVQLDPQVGRASYVGDHAIGRIDPGAVAVAIWLESLNNLFFQR